MNTSFSSSPSTALVLGGGGSAGNAWLIGVLAGLSDAGVGATDTDLIVGTSAGSTAAAQLAGSTPASLFADILAAPPLPARPGNAVDQLERTAGVIAVSVDAADMRRRMGASALALPASSDPEAQRRWRAIVASRLPSNTWPQRRTLITAVDAETGEPVVFAPDSGVDLVDAVAASCAGGFAYAVGTRRYIDGGYRTNADNADLAAGYARVLVLSPLGGRTRLPAEWGLDLAAQVGQLQANGSEVDTVFPDDDALDAFGDNLMDPSTRPAAARAGFAQGARLAGGLRGVRRG